MAHAELRGVVALDGPSGTGKSTVARKLASTFDAAYLDTGAMYRAATLAVLRARIEPLDPAEVARVVESAKMDVSTDPVHPSVLLDGSDVGREIRGSEVTGAVSAVSAVSAVRELLVAEQRRVISAVTAERSGIVVEGRDIGTVVVPNAGLKVYLTASAYARAQRRSAQDAVEGRRRDLERTHADVQRRDALDTGRAVSPLRIADDAVELDTTELDVTGVLEQLHKLAESRGLLVDMERTVR